VLHILLDDRYEARDLLGVGGMAKVYLAHDKVLDRDVALKVLREEFADDEEFVERFKREALSAASLSHPNIVSVYDRGEAEDGTSYIAMEYVPGGTLKERISSSGPLDLGLTISLALQIAEALGAAHECGVVHRDIKSRNVLLTATGDVKVVDFGIARAANATTISHLGDILGTASYMSPEQALGKPATPKSDLYSLGVVLYEMLTGKLPYTAENPVAVSMKHLNEPLRPPKELNPEIPEDLNAVVSKLLAKDPEDRCESAAEVAEELRRICDELSPVAAGPLMDDTEETRVATEATAPLPPAATTRSWRRMPWVLAGILPLLVLLGGIGWALSQGLREQDSPGGQAGQMAEVPSVGGLPQEQAKQKLNASGFKVNVRLQENSAADAGKVLDQSPAAGERAEKGSRVVIEVGNGPATVEVPDVVGLSVSEAETKLAKAELSVGLQREKPSDTKPEGVVVEQEYPAGTRVEPETAVDLRVSSGSQQKQAASNASNQNAPAPATASASATAAASASATAAASAPATAPATASATAPALQRERNNSGPGSSDSGGGD
jgi:beta-lactam-binding protein with PASTA domain/tRNA A-37 threonylcarbamoyl transferase component Bud32